jgi:hypothetical protein
MTNETPGDSDLLLKRLDLKLKIFEAIAERAYKIFALSLAGALGAALFAGNAVQTLRSGDQTQAVGMVWIGLGLQTIPNFLDSALFAGAGLVGIWLFSMVAQASLLNAADAQANTAAPQPDASFNWRRASLWFISAIIVLSGFFMAKHFVSGLSDLKSDAIRISLDLEVRLKSR